MKQNYNFKNIKKINIKKKRSTFLKNDLRCPRRFNGCTKKIARQNICTLKNVSLSSDDLQVKKSL